MLKKTKSGLLVISFILLIGSISNCSVGDNSSGNESAIITNSMGTLNTSQYVYLIAHNAANASYRLSVWADNLSEVNPNTSKLIVQEQAVSGGNIIDGTLLLPKVGPEYFRLNRSRAYSGASPIDYGDVPSSWSNGTGTSVGTYSTSFFLHNYSTGAEDSTTATLRAVGTNTNGIGNSGTGITGMAQAYIFVQNTEWNNGHVNSTDVKAIADAFNGPSGIYTRESSLIGYEAGGSSGNGGNDGNRNLYIILADIQDSFANGSFIAGYFSSLNETAAANSCNKQILIIDTSPGMASHSTTLAISTLAHEYQHMINYNQKTIIGGHLEETWLDEACSMLAEDLFDPSAGGTGKRVSDDSNRISYYLGYPDRSLTAWDNNNSLPDYGKSYSFLAFLARNTSSQLLKQIVSGSGKTSVGVSAVQSALTSVSSSLSFSDAYKAWREAIIYHNNSLSWKGYPAVSGLNALDLTTYHINKDGYWYNPSDLPAFHYFRTAKPLISDTYDPYTTIIFKGQVSANGSVNLYYNGDSSSMDIKTLVTNF